MGTLLYQEDLCNLVLVSDRRLNQVFVADMFSQGVFDDSTKTGKRKGDGVDGVGGEEVSHEQGGRGCGDDVKVIEGAPKPPTALTFGPQKVVRWSKGGEPPPAGDSVKSYIREVLPKLSMLSTVLDRCDAHEE